MAASRATPGRLWTGVVSTGAEARRFRRLAALRGKNGKRKDAALKGGRYFISVNRLEIGE